MNYGMAPQSLQPTQKAASPDLIQDLETTGSLIQQTNAEEICLDATHDFPKFMDITAVESHSIIAAMIHLVNKDPSITRLTFLSVPMELAAAVLEEFPKERLKSIYMDFTSEKDTEADDVKLICLAESIVKHSTSLEDLGLHGLTRKFSSRLFSAITMLSRVRKLHLSGSSRKQCVIESPADMLGLASILRMPTVVCIHLDWVSFVTESAVKALAQALKCSDVEALKIGENVQFPEETLSCLATALAGSHLRELDFDSIVSLDFLFAFRKGLTQKQTVTTLERLSFYSSSGTLDLVCQEKVGCHKLCHRLDASWREPVLKMLQQNHRRRICPVLFSAIDTAKTKEARDRNLLEALEAADVAILYDQLCRNQGNLQGVLWEAVHRENRTSTITVAQIVKEI